MCILSPMLVRFTCGSCSARLETEASSAGHRIPCPSCGAAVEVPPAVVGPGVTIAGFRIERLIGEGGMGRVYLARQLSMDRPVALKILPAAMAADPRIAERFIQEVRLTARLDHAHLVTAYEAGQDDGVLFFAMAYVNGRSLHDRLMKEGPLPEREALVLTLKIARALAYAWQEHRLLHRDIKPANILLDARGEPKLADLGLARTMDELDSGLTLPGTILGTPNYMSPEAAEGRPLDVRSDIYSLGATLWTMLTARVPFDGEPLVAVLRKQATEPYPDVRAWNPAVSPATCALLDRMLAKDPRDRFASWEEVIRAIEEAWGAATPEPRHRLLAPLLGSALLLVLLLTLAAIRLVGCPRRSERSAASLNQEPTPMASPGGVPEASDASSGSSPSLARSVAPPPLREEPHDRRVGEAEQPSVPSEKPVDGMQWFDWSRVRDRAQPDDRAALIARLREVSRRLRDSQAQYIRELADHFGRLPSPAREVASVLARLRREAQRAMEQGDYEGLIRRFSEYEGPFKEETETFRQERIAEARAALERSQPAPEQVAPEAIEPAHAAVAEALFRGDRRAALEYLRRWGAETPVSELKTFAGVLTREIEGLPEIHGLILETFRTQRGQTVRVEFKDGRIDSLRIVSVGPAGIRAQRDVAEGFIEIEFTPAHLHPRDIWTRLGTLGTPSARIVRGLFAADHQQWEVAAAAFESAETPLGDLLAREAKKKTSFRETAMP